MTAGRFDFPCVKGQELDVNIHVKNPDNTDSNLLYWGSRMHVRGRTSDPDTLIELSTDNGRIAHNVNSATISVSLSAEETASLPEGQHVYDLELFSTGAKPAVVRLVHGFFIVS
jgi:hypothetical protein